MSYRSSWFAERALPCLLVLALVGCKDSKKQPRAAAPDDAAVAKASGEAGTGPRSSLDATTGRAPRSLADTQLDDWYGVYLGDHKLGFARLTISRDGDSIRSRLAATVRGDGSELQIVETKIFDAKPPYQLREVIEVQESDDGKRTISARRQGAHMVSGNKRAISANTLEAELIERKAAIEGWLEGREARVPQFDLELFRDEIARIQVVSSGAVKTMGVDTEQIVIDFWGEGDKTAMRSVYDRQGRFLRGAMGDFSFRLEDERVAKSQVEGFDVISDVAVDGELGELGDRDRLQVVVVTRPGFEMPESDNQKVQAVDDGRWLVTRTRAPGAALPSDVGRWLQATGSFDYEEPTIARLAAELGAGKLAAPEYTAKVVHWVFDNLDKDLSTDLSSASQVLRERVGDCTEHSLLTIALLRAAGLPAREVSGLMYKGDQYRSFGFHSWVEVGLDGRWVAVDPSWNQLLADPGHLTLGVGDDSDWVATLASLKIEVPATR